MIPTVEPVSERILVDLETALASIDRGHATIAYWTTVRKVLRVRAGYPDTGDRYVVIWLTGTQVSDDLDSQVHSVNTETLGFQVDGWIEDASSDVITKLERFAQDIRNALTQDPTRGGLAIHTSIRAVRIGLAPDVTEPFNKVEIDVDVRYRTRVSDLTLTN